MTRGGAKLRKLSHEKFPEGKVSAHRPWRGVILGESDKDREKKALLIAKQIREERVLNSLVCRLLCR